MFIDLLEKQFGVSGTALEWFQNYLHDRKAKVCVNGQYSMEKIINYSVPQGSLLGPVFFNAYCSTLVEVIPTGISINGFADGHSLPKHCKPETKSELETVELLETSMVEVHYWMKENRWKHNPNKTEFIKFGYQTQLEKSKVENINICDSVMTLSIVVWYLGAWLDSQMNLKHLATMKCKAETLNLRKI